jgi:hypothetical protein
MSTKKKILTSDWLRRTAEEAAAREPLHVTAARPPGYKFSSTARAPTASQSTVWVRFDVSSAPSVTVSSSRWLETTSARVLTNVSVRFQPQLRVDTVAGAKATVEARFPVAVTR